VPLRAAVLDQAVKQEQPEAAGVLESQVFDVNGEPLVVVKLGEVGVGVGGPVTEESVELWGGWLNVPKAREDAGSGHFVRCGDSSYGGVVMEDLLRAGRLASWERVGRYFVLLI